jgi:glycine hydroxymethyltransferase
VALLEALGPEFRAYQTQVVQNARTMSAVLAARGYKIVSGGTDNHLFLLDLIDKDVTGKDADAWLGAAHITVNKNAVPGDPRSPFVTSGLRIGTPAVTTRGFGEAEVRQVAGWIADIIDDRGAPETIARVRKEALALCARFPVYGSAPAAPKTKRKAKPKARKPKATPRKKARAKPRAKRRSRR